MKASFPADPTTCNPINLQWSIHDWQELTQYLARRTPRAKTSIVKRNVVGRFTPETVAVCGCGPVGQFAIKSAFLLGAERVIAIDTVPERLALAQASGAVTPDFKKEDIYDRVQELTNGRGADACIDAVGTEPDTGSGFDVPWHKCQVSDVRYLVAMRGKADVAGIAFLWIRRLYKAGRC